MLLFSFLFWALRTLSSYLSLYSDSNRCCSRHGFPFSLILPFHHSFSPLFSPLSPASFSLMFINSSIFLFLFSFLFLSPESAWKTGGCRGLFSRSGFFNLCTIDIAGREFLIVGSALHTERCLAAFLAASSFPLPHPSVTTKNVSCR